MASTPATRRVRGATQRSKASIRVLDWLESHPNQTLEDLASELHLDRRTLRLILEGLEEMRLISCDKTLFEERWA